VGQRGRYRDGGAGAGAVNPVENSIRDILPKFGLAGALLETFPWIA
jgi:hypothetical protein